jgi:hypothetical protein
VVCKNEISGLIGANVPVRSSGPGLAVDIVCEGQVAVCGEVGARVFGTGVRGGQMEVITGFAVEEDSGG